MTIMWNESMSVGIDLLDEQHKELIKQMNILVEAISHGTGEDRLEEILEFFEGYTQNHFKMEEDCMEKYQCPVAQINKKAHIAFIDTFHKLQKQVNEDHISNTLLAINISNELVSWFINHICQVDTKLKPCVKP